MLGYAGHWHLFHKNKPEEVTDCLVPGEFASKLLDREYLAKITFPPHKRRLVSTRRRNLLFS